MAMVFTSPAEIPDDILTELSKERLTQVWE